jgi:hypothetical protein
MAAKSIRFNPPPPDPPAPRGLLTASAPIWSIGLLTSVEAGADLADVLVATAEALVAANRVRVEFIGGERKIRVDDLIRAAAEPPSAPTPAPLGRRLADRRRRRATGELLLGFRDGDGAEGRTSP